MYIRYGEWLRREAAVHRLPVLAPRPYESLVERILDAAAPGPEIRGA
jgi:hypothetical protein